MRIIVLLSTYNGEKFLNEQISSILTQTFPDWTILARDDGSSDRTPFLLREWQAKLGSGKINILSGGGRLGVQRSFLTLLSSAPAGELYAFCDQDDVWLPNKLERAFQVVSQFDHKPALFCSIQKIVDAKLSVLGMTKAPKSPPSLKNALVQNIVTGATCVLNQKAREQILSLSPPPNILHDWWTYAVVAAADGHIFFDEKATILYRQHNLNVLGAPSNTISQVFRALRRGPLPFAQAVMSLTDALRKHPNIPHQSKSLAEQVFQLTELNFIKRIHRAKKIGLYRQSSLETWATIFWLALGLSFFDRRTA